MSTTVRKNSVERFKLPRNLLYKAERAWLLFIRGVFASAPRGCYRWSATATESEIIITGVQPTEKAAQHKKPIIIVERMTAATLGESRDGLLQSTNYGGDKTHTWLYRFPLRIMAVAKEGVEAEDILWYIQDLVPYFTPQIQRAAGMHMIGRQHQLSRATKHSRLIPASSIPDWCAAYLQYDCSLQNSVSVSASEDSFLQLAKSVSIQLDTVDPA